MLYDPRFLGAPKFATDRLWIGTAGRLKKFQNCQGLGETIGLAP
jgi:hypothetical protein